MSAEKIYDLVIVGAGPAGVGAAIQSNIYGLRMLVIEKREVGGRLRLARKVGNFLYPNGGRGRSGRFLAESLRRRLMEEGIRIIEEEVKEILWEEEKFCLYGSQGQVFSSSAVILATGTRPKNWRVSLESGAERYIYPDWKSLPRPKDQRVAVIGGGETAFDQACSLAEHGAKVLLIIRARRPKAYPGLVREASALGVEVITRSQVVKVLVDDRGICMLDSHGSKIRCQSIVPSIGWLAQRPRMDERVRMRKGRGLFFAGDVVEKKYRQAAIAFGSGVGAAMSVWEYLGGLR